MKLCTDCTHCDKHGSFPMGFAGPLRSGIPTCRRPLSDRVSLVDGRPNDLLYARCSDERRSRLWRPGRHCGPEARFYEPKSPVEILEEHMRRERAA